VLLKVESGQLLDPADPVEEGVAVHRECGGGRGAVETAGSQAPEGCRQVPGIAALKRAEDTLGEAVGELCGVREEELRPEVGGGPELGPGSRRVLDQEQVAVDEERRPVEPGRGQADYAGALR